MKWFNIDNTSRVGRRRLPFFVPMVVLTGIVLALAGVGCGSSDDDSDDDSPDPVVRTGTFFGASTTATGNDGSTFTVGRTYITLNVGVPQVVGFEMSDEAITKQKPTAIADEDPNIYFVPLPAEVSDTVFKTVAVFYFTGHPVDERPNGEPEHFHIAFQQQAPHTPDEPDYVQERVVPASEELPTGISKAEPEAFLPGIGVNYDDPTEPAGQAARTTNGLNFLYYAGHMNAYVVGQNSRFLQSRETYRRTIPQPEIYPTPGYYPTRCTVRYEASRDVYVFELSEFVLAARSRKPNR